MRALIVSLGLLMLAGCATAQVPVVAPLPPPPQPPVETATAARSEPLPSAAPAPPVRPAVAPLPSPEPAAPKVPPEPAAKPKPSSRVATPAPAPAATAPAAPGAPKLVIVVLDGDTVDINGARWRLTGYDAPEIGDRAKCDEERRLGERARARLQQIVGAAKVETSTKGQRDAYGRVLGRITADGRNVGDILRDEGLASAGRRNWCAAKAPTKRAVPARAERGSHCAGLDQRACGGAGGCRWVAHTKKRDKNGRPLTDHCRKAGRG